MRQETLDLSYDLDIVLDEIERAVAAADGAGYEAAVAETHEALEQRSLLKRLKSTVVAWLF